MSNTKSNGLNSKDTAAKGESSEVKPTKQTNLAAARIALLRRKLTVSGDAPKLDGYSEEPETPQSTEAPTLESCAIPLEIYTGQSKKGFAPFNTGKKNQDSYFIRSDPATNSIIFSVMDGHGEVGHLVSDFVKQNLAPILINDPSWKTDIPSAIKRSVETVENKLLKVKAISSQFSGTTLVFAVIRGKTLYCGNVGDSRLILGSLQGGTIKPVTISIDHKPDLPAEKARIVASGGRVYAIQYDDELGPPRVWLKNMDIPGLAMSRSVGDTVAHSVGVTSEPEIFIHELSSSDKYMIIASDGLWEFMSNEQVMSVVTAYDKLEDAIAELMKISSDLWLKSEQVIDDTTIIIAKIKV